MTVRTQELLKKADYMETTYRDAISWIDAQLASPEIANVPEKIEKLREARDIAESGIKALAEEKENLKRRLSDAGAGSVFTVAKTMNEFGF